jgi:hypothetical protein
MRQATPEETALSGLEMVCDLDMRFVSERDVT